jgi:multiple sugar transport system permease protein
MMTAQSREGVQSSSGATAAKPSRPIQASSIAIHTVLILGAITMVAPFLWMMITAFKSLGESVQVPPTILPQHWQFSNYNEVLTGSGLSFVRLSINSVIMTAGRTIGQLVFCSLAAYAFARIKFPGRTFFFVLFLSVLMVPSQVFMIPQYLIMEHLGWLNSLKAITVPGMFSAFGTFLLRQFFMGLPDELEEAARLDGANHFQIYWRIMLPLARPGLLALAIFTVIWSWNDFLWPLIVNSSPDQMPLASGLATLQGLHTTNYPVLMAGTLLATWPMILIFILLQRQFVEGIALTGGK